jgi:hypothetical protein
VVDTAWTDKEGYDDDDDTGREVVLRVEPPSSYCARLCPPGWLAETENTRLALLFTRHSGLNRLTSAKKLDVELPICVDVDRKWYNL